MYRSKSMTVKSMSEDPRQVYKEILKKYQESTEIVRRPFFSEGVEFSLTDKKILPAPRDQGLCQCCVHLTMTVMIGAMLALQTDLNNRLLRLFSYQHIIDCMKHEMKIKEDDKGCKVSTFQEVFNFIRSNGIVEYHVYPYCEQKGECRDPACDKSDSSSRSKGKSKKHSDSPSTSKGKYVKRRSDEPEILQNSKRVRLNGNGELKKIKLRSFDKVKELIKKGPLAVFVPVTRDFSKFINTDKIQDVFPPVKKSKKSISKKTVVEPTSRVPTIPTNHAILLIGYGNDEATRRDFYMVLNSWPNWGFYLYGYGKIEVDYFSKEAEGFYIGSDIDVTYE